MVRGKAVVGIGAGDAERLAIPLIARAGALRPALRCARLACAQLRSHVYLDVATGEHVLGVDVKFASGEAEHATILEGQILSAGDGLPNHFGDFAKGVGARLIGIVITLDGGPLNIRGWRGGRCTWFLLNLQGRQSVDLSSEHDLKIVQKEEYVWSRSKSTSSIPK